VRRRNFLAALSAMLAMPLATHAQPAPQRQRIGFLHPGRSRVGSVRAASFGQGLLLTKLGVLWDPATGSVPLQALERVMASLYLPMQVQEVRRAGDFEGAFRAIGQAEGTGLLLLPSPLVASNLQLVADLSLTHRFPAITLFPEFGHAGGLLAYGPDLTRLFRQAGALTRKILDGANPAVQPIERPARFQLVVNLKTAEALGVTVPTSVLLLADEVVE
jgi:putative tryptophan/tyrosine transport system substrate-binding protein